MSGLEACLVCLVQAVFDLEATNAELKSDLRDLYITKAEEIDGKSGRKAIIIHVRAGLDVLVGHGHVLENRMRE